MARMARMARFLARMARSHGSHGSPLGSHGSHGSLARTLVKLKSIKGQFLKKSLMGQQGKVLYSRQKCLAVNSVSSTSYGLNNDVFKDLSLQTCYSSVVYLKCLKAFFVFNFKTS